jgi:N-acetylglucosaminyldiphosphoundecaprenol N-acetyl-beta-D-mannosaminyltransferase
LTVTPDRGALRSRRILGMRVDATSYDDAADRVVTWAKAGESRSVCVAAVSTVMAARDDRVFRATVDAADLVTPDGMPLVWGLRWLGVPSATRVYGPELMPVILSRAASEHVPVAFVGGTPSVLDRLTSRAIDDFPGLRVVHRSSPVDDGTPSDLDAEIAAEIRASGARIVFVGLGCPKQERWMARQRASVEAVMLGVGAAFDFLAGVKPQAPPLLRRAGLEWLFRLVTEPRRLSGRYLRQNPRFAILFARQLLAERGGRRPDGLTRVDTADEG